MVNRKNNTIRSKKGAVILIIILAALAASTVSSLYFPNNYWVNSIRIVPFMIAGYLVGTFVTPWLQWVDDVFASISGEDTSKEDTDET